MAQQMQLSHDLLKVLQGVGDCDSDTTSAAMIQLLRHGDNLQAVDIREGLLEVALNLDSREQSRLSTIMRLVACGASVGNIVTTCVAGLARDGVCVKLETLIGVAHWAGRAPELRQHLVAAMGDYPDQCVWGWFARGAMPPTEEVETEIANDVGAQLLSGLLAGWPNGDKEWTKATIKHLVLGAVPMDRACLEFVGSQNQTLPFRVFYKAACQAGRDAHLNELLQDKFFHERTFKGFSKTDPYMQRLRDIGLIGPLATSMQSALEQERAELFDELFPVDGVRFQVDPELEQERAKLRDEIHCISAFVELLNEYAKADLRYAKHLSTSLEKRLPVGPAELIAAFVIVAPCQTEGRIAVPEASNGNHRSDAPSVPLEEVVPNVIELIEHEEPSPPIDPDVAHTTMELAWADNVEARLADQAADPRCADEIHVVGEEDDRKIWLLRFGSASKGSAANTERFRTTLLEGPELQPVRAALQDAGYPVELISKAKVFVQPGEYRAVLAHIVQPLSPYHVIVDSAYEHLLDAALTTIPYSKRPKEKRRESFATPSNNNDGLATPSSDEGDVDDMFLAEERTFLTFARALRNPRSVAQSTTEATGAVVSDDYPQSHGCNPRRKVYLA